jgi:hypothetical protein
MSTVGAIGLSESNQKYLFIKQINKLGITANNSTIYIPATAHILLFDITETAGNAITGGLDVGTTLNGADIISALAVTASAAAFAAPDAALLKRIFPTRQQLFIAAHTNWNGASINVNIIYAARVEFGT